MELTDFPSYLSMSKNGKTKKNSGKSNAADVVQGKNFLVISLIICILFYLFCVLYLRLSCTLSKSTR